MSPELVDWVQAYGAIGLCAAAFVGATLVPVSSEAAFVAAVAAGLAPSTALLWASVGNTVGCLVNYGIGWTARERVGDRLMGSRSGRAALRWTERYGLPALLLSWLPVIGDPLTLAAGVGRIRLLWFVPLVAGLRVARYAALLWLV
ncbi:MAG: SNARE-like domain protein [Rhodothermaceae bacterium]|nr:SNARE-like domain protein [Rhodothermaceae bacterium]MBC13207.1 SNARE-like domain protein [Rhodothermaceae bacterium]